MAIAFGAAGNRSTVVHVGREFACFVLDRRHGVVFAKFLAVGAHACQEHMNTEMSPTLRKHREHLVNLRQHIASDMGASVALTS